MLHSPVVEDFRLDSSAEYPATLNRLNEGEKGMLSGELVLPKKRKILIVQGDWEMGMSKLALDLMEVGHKVGKIVFCAPDLVYKLKGIRVHFFRKPLADFESWMRDLIKGGEYDTFFLYNHYRPYNQVAWKLAEELKLRYFVFELGLIRPNYVTVFSGQNPPIPAMLKAWEELQAGGPKPEPTKMPPELCQVSSTAKLVSFCSFFVLSRITCSLFPNFVDQRDMKLWGHFKHGLIYLCRFIERGRDCELDEVFAGPLAGKYYAVPLQVHSDTQITINSNFKSIEQFIKRVVYSFERHAPAGTKLVFKVHPMDRGYKDYTNLLARLDHRLGGNRIYYVDRVHLPTLLANALGVVNINSSVGISGLVHHVPVITLGKAVYNLPDLTYQGKLDTFWTEAQKPINQHVINFINLLLKTNQGRGTLSQCCFDVPGRCKIQWPEPFQKEFFPYERNFDASEASA